MTTTQPHKRGVVYVTLKEYLAKLEAIEATATEERRREVPSMAALAKVAGVEPMTLSRWVTGKIKATNHSTAGAIIQALRARGFDTKIEDILAYREVES